MKDPDNGNDVKNDDSKGDADDMSLADLLGGDTGEDSETPERVDQRDDEPDSGMVNLAKMVADSSVETAKVPSIVPPPAAAEDQTGQTDTTGPVATAAQAPVAAPAAAEKKSNPMIPVLIVLVIVIGAVAIYFGTRDEEPKGDDEVTKALMAKLEALEKEQKEAEAKMAKLESERKEVEAAQVAAQAKLDELKKGGDAGQLSAEEQAEMDEAQKALEEAKAKEEELAAAAAEAEKKAEEAKKKASKASGKKDTKVAKADTPKKDTSKKSSGGDKLGADDLLKESKKKGTSKKDSSKTDTKKGGASELDSLLGGGDKKKDDAPKEDKPAAPSLPKRLSMAQVKAGMAPVQARAQKMCAKYSTGTVQVQLVIGGNGRVKSATPKGAFGNSTAGNCVAMQARTAKFPKFSDASQSVLYPISLK